MYRYGYLWSVHSLYNWWRDQGRAGASHGYASIDIRRRTRRYRHRYRYSRFTPLTHLFGHLGRGRVAAVGAVAVLPEPHGRVRGAPLARLEMPPLALWVLTSRHTNHLPPGRVQGRCRLGQVHTRATSRHHQPFLALPHRCGRGFDEGGILCCIYRPLSFFFACETSGYPLELVNCFAPPPKEYVFPKDLYPFE